MHQRLATALSHDEFRVFYQPTVDLRTGQFVGAEALCRWPQPGDKFTPPETFITQAETSGFIIQLGEWVMKTAVDQLRQWRLSLSETMVVAVNLSARQFLHFNLMKSIEQLTREAGIPPSSIEFEITESVAMRDPEDSIGVMRQVKSLGMTLALDDFGTGYSSLAYLKRLPIDKLKIDKSFVRDIPNDANDLAIVSAILAMAHALGLKVQAEGVETQAQADFLRDCGCEFAQGFLFGRAVPADDFASLFIKNNAA
jgi:EAL domain-containing protein (putative c-di-GMP-specific phosphodiesterase class I)